MNNIANNLKRLRQQKSLTQEQTANALGVSMQTVSRWECGITCPDIMLLPEIARLYCVTVDDLFREDSSAYENYAQRLASVFEISHNPEDYLKADLEFNKLKKAGIYTHEDCLKHGAIHTSMMLICKQLANQCFDRITSECEQDGNTLPDNLTYWSARYHRLVSMGQPEKAYEKQEERLQKHSDNYMEWTVLIYSYYYAGKNEKAYEVLQEAIDRFADKWELYMVGGYVCKALKKYEEALAYADQACKLSNKYMDALYIKAFCLQEMGNYEQAYTAWLEIIEKLKQEGYDVEAQREEKRAQACLDKIKR